MRAGDVKGHLGTQLMNQGIASSNAEVGKLIHFALRDLCPDVPSKTRI